MNAIALFKTAKAWGPVLFAIAFLAPLVAQSMQRADLSAPWGMSPLLFGFAITVPLGLIAQHRGTWL